MKYLVTALFLLAVSGCTTYVSNDKITEAVERCKNNDGVHDIKIKDFLGTDTHYARCNNGATFNLKAK